MTETPVLPDNKITKSDSILRKTKFYYLRKTFQHSKLKQNSINTDPLASKSVY